MSKVFIYCDGGFGNRYNSLLSGLFLAKACNREPLVIWPETRWAEVSFTDIFDSNLAELKQFDPITFFEKYDPVNIVHWNPWGASVEQHNCMGIYMCIDQFLKNKEHKNIMFYSSLICPWVDTNGLQSIITKIPFHSYLVDTARQFIKYNFEENEFDGLHVRRTDHAYQLEEKEFIEKINNSSRLCFVCSDDKEAERNFLENCPNVRVYPKTSYVEMQTYRDWETDRKSTRLNSSHSAKSRMPSSA